MEEFKIGHNYTLIKSLGSKDKRFSIVETFGSNDFLMNQHVLVNQTYLNIYFTELKNTGRLRKFRAEHKNYQEPTYITVLCQLNKYEFLIIGQNIIKFRIEDDDKLIRFNSNLYENKIYICIISAKYFYIFIESEEKYMTLKRTLFKNDDDFINQYLTYIQDIKDDIKNYIMSIIAPTKYSEYLSLEVAKRENYFTNMLVIFIYKSSLFKNYLYAYIMDNFDFTNYTGQIIINLNFREFTKVFNELSETLKIDTNQLYIKIQDQAYVRIWQYFMVEYDKLDSRQDNIKYINFDYLNSRLIKNSIFKL